MIVELESIRRYRDIEERHPTPSMAKLTGRPLTPETPAERFGDFERSVAVFVAIQIAAIVMIVVLLH